MFTNSCSETYRPDIDGLRALAVFSVIFYHLEIPGFSGGFVGVDIFFVISGYLITRNIVDEYGKGVWSFQRFYIRRARRLFPALFFTLCFSFIFAFLLLTPERFVSFAQSLLYTSALAPNVYFWSETGYFDISAQLKPLLHLWSLGLEEQFYLLWPLLLIGLLRFSVRAIIPFLVTVVLLSVFYGQRWLDIDADASFYLLPFRCFEFAIGALLVFSGDIRLRSMHIENTVLLAALGLIACSICFYNDTMAFPGISALIPCIAAAIAIFSGRASATGRILNNKITVSVGLISYSLYLIHWPLLVYYQYWVFRVLTPEEKTGIVIVSLVLAFLMYRFIEQPFRYGRRNVLSYAGFAGAGLALTLILAFTAAHVWALDGLYWRIDSEDKLDNARKAGLHREIKCIQEQAKPGCLFGARKAGTEDILVIGDSHSQNLWYALDYLAKPHNFKIRGWSHNGCPPVFDIEIKFISARTAEKLERQCNKKIQQWQNYIERTSPKIVVLAARWTLYYESFENYGFSNRPGKLMLDKTNPVYTKSASRHVFIEKLAKTMDIITASGSKLIVFSQAPEVGVDPPDCSDVPTYLLEQQQKEKRCQFVSYETMMARLAFTDDTIRRLAGAQADVMSVMMKNVFCDREKHLCRFFEDGQPLYQDSHHLSVAGSIKVARHIEKRFNAFLVR